MNKSTMRKIVRKIIGSLDSYQAFVSTYIILAFISYIPLLRITLGFLTKLILVWGFYLLIRKVLVKWRLRREKSTWLAIGLLGAYLVACLINYQWDLAINLLNFSYATLNLVVLFAMNGFDSLAALLKSFRQTAGLVVGLSFASSLLSIGMFFFDIKYLVIVDGFTISQGFIYGRLWGVYSSPNSAAMLAIFSVGLTTALLMAPKTGRHVPGTVFGVLNLLVQFTFAALSGSRGYILSILAFSMTLGFFCLMILIRKIKEIRRHGLRGAALGDHRPVGRGGPAGYTCAECVPEWLLRARSQRLPTACNSPITTSWRRPAWPVSCLKSSGHLRQRPRKICLPKLRRQ